MGTAPPRNYPLNMAERFWSGFSHGSYSGRSLLETLFSHWHVSQSEVRGHVTSSVSAFDWMEEELEVFYSSKQKNVVAILDDKQIVANLINLQFDVANLNCPLLLFWENPLRNSAGANLIKTTAISEFLPSSPVSAEGWWMWAWRESWRALAVFISSRDVSLVNSRTLLTL